MKNFDDQAFDDISDDGVEILDLDASRANNRTPNVRHGLCLSPRARILLALSTLTAAILLFVLILKPSLPSPAPPPAKPGNLSISLPASAKASQVNSDNGIAIINTPEGIIYALRASDGLPLWHFKAPTRVSIQVLDQVVYLIPVNQSGFNGFVIALRASNGSVLWGQSIPSPGPLAPVISNGTIYVSGHGGDVIYALRARDGYTLWQYGVNPSLDYYPPPFSTIERVDNQIYLLSAENVLYVLRASDGSYLWSYRYKSYETDAGLPTVEDGFVYINGQDGAIRALLASDGSPLWQYHPSAGPRWPALVQNGVVYVSEKGGTMSALNSSNGALIHAYKNIGIINNRPIVQNGVIYINAPNDALEAIRASDGSRLWSYNALSYIIWPPQIDGNTAYIISQGGVGFFDKVLTAINLKDGTDLWRYDMGSMSSLLIHPNISGNIAYISINATTITALRSNDGTVHWFYASHTPITLLSGNNGFIYLSLQNGNVNALQASDGNLLWQFP